MRSLVLFTATLWLSGLAACANSGKPITVSNRFIIQLSAESDVAAVTTGTTHANFNRRVATDPHAVLFNHLRKRQVDYNVEHAWDKEPDIFLGVSLTLADPLHLKVLLEAPGVQRAWPVTLVPRPQFVGDLKTVQLANDTKGDTLGPHVQTRVSDLHARGIDGKGVFVAVIDTGVDYRNKLLGGCFGPGCKVEAGYDLVGDQYDGSNSPVPDSDPMDCAGHGTHVSGIIAANQGQGFSGVAPNAKLGVWRIFGCSGSASTDIIVDALLRAYRAGADVLSLSLGGATGWPERPDAVVAASIVAAGRTVVIANGNNADQGLFYAESPASGTGVVAVAAANNIETYTFDATTSNGLTVPYYSGVSLNVSGLPLFISSLHNITTESDACTNYTSATPDLAPYVVLIRRGTCFLSDKITNAANHGAKYVLIYTDDESKSMPALDLDAPRGVRAALIPLASGIALIKAYQANPNVTISFPPADAPSHGPETRSPGKISDFSTYGPNWDLSGGPSVAGVGNNVLSTYLVENGGAAVGSGTSMATPQIAGIAALLLSQKPKMPGLEVRARLVASARPVYDAKGGPLLESVAHQGAGLVDAYCTVFATTQLSESSLLLNDTRYFAPAQNFSITNTGSEAVTFKLSHIPAGTVNVFGNSGSGAGVTPWPVPLTNAKARVTFSQAQVSVPAGGKVDVQVRFNPPTGLKASRFPLYSGYIALNSTKECESKVLPYFGVAANMYDMHVLDRTSSMPSVYSVLTNGSNTRFTLAGDDIPQIGYKLASGTSLVAVDLVTSNSTALSTRSLPGLEPDAFLHSEQRRSPVGVAAAGKHHVGRGLGQAAGHLKMNMARRAVHKGASGPSTLAQSLGLMPPSTDVFRGVHSLGLVDQDTYYPRTDNADGSFFSFNFTGIVTTPAGVNATVPDGDYKMFLRVLKITGDRQKASDWETWLSPTFTIKRH